ncbi:MAG: hypothetical protein H0U23_05460 [Blastocatellia bacterium]|nr:hypothetical protein [Blastocatellia bacterium]
MNIRISRVSEGFRFFPYPPDYENGRTNNGGIDLVREPHRLDEITELSAVPSLRRIIADMRGPDSPFMTLGIEAGPRDEFFDGYLEFAFRDAALNTENNYRELIGSFCDWVSREYPEFAESIGASFVAELQHFHLHGIPHGDRVTLWFHTMNKEACDQLLRILARFLLLIHPRPKKQAMQRAAGRSAC